MFESEDRPERVAHHGEVKFHGKPACADGTDLCQREGREPLAYVGSAGYVGNRGLTKEMLLVTLQHRAPVLLSYSPGDLLN